MPSTPQDLIRHLPLGKITPCKPVRVDVRNIVPVIHIAHRLSNPLVVPERIIFDHELVLILKGRGTFRIGDERFTFSPHTLFFIPPFVPNEIYSGGKSEHAAIHFDFSAGLPKNPSRRKPYQIHFSHELSIPSRLQLQPSDGIEDACLQIVRSFAAIDPLAELDASAGLSQLLIRLMRIRPLPTNDSAGQARIQVLVAKAITFIESNVANKLAADELAEHVGLSESHLNRVFRQRTGYAPMEYVRRHRVQRAKELLGDLNLSVKEVAVRTGFDDAYHFSRVFRQIAGVPPTGYRDALFSRGQA